jgi:hypothetical protein
MIGRILYQPLVPAIGIVVSGPARGHLEDRGGEVGEEAAGAFEGLVFALDLVVHRSVPGVDGASPQALLVDLLADSGHEGRARDKEL